MMDLKRAEEGWGWRFMDVMWHQKNLKNNAGFEPFLPIVPVIKFEFLSTDFFLGGSKDNIKQTTQVNNDNNIKLF